MLFQSQSGIAAQSDDFINFYCHPRGKNTPLIFSACNRIAVPCWYLQDFLCKPFRRWGKYQLNALAVIENYFQFGAKSSDFLLKGQEKIVP